MITVPGLGSGLDVAGIVSQLVEVERQPVAQRLDRQEANLQGRLSAFGVLRAAIDGFQSSLAALSDASGFQARTAASADTDVATVSATNSAAAGSFSLDVTQLAASNSLVSDNSLPSAQFTDITDIVGTGSLTFSFGTTTYDPNTDNYQSFVQDPAKATQLVQITDGSLAGIRDAVNVADIGVSASIVFDGSNQRLSFTSTESGAANSLEISVADDDGDNGDSAGLSLLSFNASSNNLLQTEAALDAQVSINGIDITSASNTLADNIDGLTINLLATGTSTLAVSDDASKIAGNVNNFVSQYNGLVGTINNLSSFNAATGAAGILNGDAVLRTLEGQFRRILSNPVEGAQDNFSILANIGITRSSEDGTLVVDSKKLNDTIASNPAAVTGLFAAFGVAADSLIDVSTFSGSTLAGSYAVDITQLATQGQIAASSAAALTITAGVDDTLTLNVDGIDATVTLAAGTYTATELLTELQTKINSASAFFDAGVSVTATETGGLLTLTSERYGSASTLAISAGTAATNLFGATPVATDGLDVAGTIGGVAATGSGQVLSASGDADGLQLTIAGGSLGDRGVINFSRGYADQLDSVLTDMLNSDGIFTSVTNTLTDQISDIDNDRQDLARRIEGIEARLLAQFTALDILMASLNSTSNFLTSQLESLPVIGARNS